MFRGKILCLDLPSETRREVILGKFFKWYLTSKLKGKIFLVSYLGPNLSDRETAWSWKHALCT